MGILNILYQTIRVNKHKKMFLNDDSIYWEKNLSKPTLSCFTEEHSHLH